MHTPFAPAGGVGGSHPEPVPRNPRCRCARARSISARVNRGASLLGVKQYKLNVRLGLNVFYDAPICSSGPRGARFLMSEVPLYKISRSASLVLTDFSQVDMLSVRYPSGADGRFMCTGAPALKLMIASG